MHRGLCWIGRWTRPRWGEFSRQGSAPPRCRGFLACSSPWRTRGLPNSTCAGRPTWQVLWTRSAFSCLAGTRSSCASKLCRMGRGRGLGSSGLALLRFCSFRCHGEARPNRLADDSFAYGVRATRRHRHRHRHRHRRLVLSPQTRPAVRAAVKSRVRKTHLKTVHLHGRTLPPLERQQVEASPIPRLQTT